MKLKQKDKLMLFSNIEIPDVFFTEYFSQANGDFVKVYLYLVFLTKYGKEIRINDLSKKLNLGISIIEDAISFWEKNGVITKNPEGFILNNLQEIELNKLYKPNLSLSTEAVENNAQNQYRAKAIESINSRCFQGIMSPAWYNDIDLWFKKYNFDEQVMIALFDYCFNKSALHRKYVQAVAEAWFESNIKTYTDLESYYQKFEKIAKIKKAIAKKLGRYSPLTEYEEGYIKKWILDFRYDLEIINIALKRTTSKAVPTFDYIDKLLTDWNERNFRTVTEVEQFLIEHKQKTKKTKELETKTNYSNYKQRNYDNLDDLYANKKG